MSDPKTLATAAGAASVVTGMSVAVDDKKVLYPLFLAGWGLVGYGITDGYTEIDPLTGAGLLGIVGGAMLSRAPMDWGADEGIAKLGEPVFLAGWAALAAGMARQRDLPFLQTALPAATIIGGAMMIRKKTFEGADIPTGLGELVFAAGWAWLVTASMQRGPQAELASDLGPGWYE